MENTTKEKILDAALVSFVENGYKGTNLRDFATGLGLSKSALYRHYESKEAIWNALLNKMEEYYSERFGSPEHLPKTPTSCEELFSLVMHMVDFTIHDEKVILTRKLLLTEQFHDDRIMRLATEHFTNDTKEIFRGIFERMIDAGILIEENPDMLALVLTASITTLIHYCDREPKKEPEIMRQIEEFVKHFIKTYERK